MRYSIVGEKNPNLLERLYDQMASRLRDQTLPLTSLGEIDAIAEVPENEEFISKLENTELAYLTVPWRVLLVRINEQMGQTELRIDDATRVHIEHILPQTPSAAALQESQVSADEAMHLRGKLGNLTLLSGTRNRKLSNRPFSEKKPVYASSDVFMTRALAGIPVWNRRSIADRSIAMAKAAAEAYPHPRELVGSERAAAVGSDRRR